MKKDKNMTNKTMTYNDWVNAECSHAKLRCKVGVAIAVTGVAVAEAGKAITNKIPGVGLVTKKAGTIATSYGISYAVAAVATAKINQMTRSGKEK